MSIDIMEYSLVEMRTTVHRNNVYVSVRSPLRLTDHRTSYTIYGNHTCAHHFRSTGQVDATAHNMHCTYNHQPLLFLSGLYSSVQDYSQHRGHLAEKLQEASVYCQPSLTNVDTNRDQASLCTAPLHTQCTLSSNL